MLKNMAFAMLPSLPESAEVHIMSSCYHESHPCFEYTGGCGHHSGCMPERPPFPGCVPPWLNDGSACGVYPQPICASPAQYSNAGAAQGATLVIHKIVLEPCGNPTCTPRTYNIRITGPSYPCGEVFQLRAGNCLSLDEPLVITGLEPGTYFIEEIYACPNSYISTFTGPVCGRRVTVSNSTFPTVVTIVSRKRLCRLCHKTCC